MKTLLVLSVLFPTDGVRETEGDSEFWPIPICNYVVTNDCHVSGGLSWSVSMETQLLMCFRTVPDILFAFTMIIANIIVAAIIHKVAPYTLLHKLYCWPRDHASLSSWLFDAQNWITSEKASSSMILHNFPIIKSTWYQFHIFVIYSFVLSQGEKKV